MGEDEALAFWPPDLPPALRDGELKSKYGWTDE